MKWFRIQWAMAVMAIVVVSGCGGGGPSVEYVEGKVTLDGTPQEGVTVTYSPTSPGSGLAAVGTTDANGVYKLTAKPAGGFEEGTAVGEYNVAFSKVATGEGLSYEETQKMMEDPNYGQSGGSEPSAPPESKDLLPAGYANPKTSGFTVTVKEGQNTGDEFSFDLKSDFQPEQ